MIFANHAAMLNLLAAHGLYVHLLPGRLRIELPAVRNDATLIDCIRETLMGVDGIRSVSCSGLTGRALVEFDAARLNHGEIVVALDRLNCFAPLLQEPSRNQTVKTFAANTMLDLVSDLVLKNGLMWALGVP